MASTPPQTEKPFHYTYLKEFRVNQCPLFLQHKCTQHRPFTCFHWHFSNQRRRRPVRRRDGTFNYSADVYCSKYDETTGICPDGDDCTYIHRNTGDTERRYHLRYYKTGTCIHETDSRGNCVKNGPHCAFAHGANDLRPPVYDIREQQCNDQVQQNQSSPVAELPTMQESINLSEKIVNDDPKWQDANYVLANYKTELCKRPPRLCRQGYACPQYHNAKDRRRNPKKYKYRSSPCPIVKQGDDWKDPSCCEKGDSCQFCHTRTEQQFHPEIYKSTKCHDMTQTGYCPRGPFCAFAHVEQEIRIIEDPSGPIPNQITMESSVGSLTDPREQRSAYSSLMGAYESVSMHDTPSGNHMWSEFARNFGGDNSEYSRSMPNQSMLTEYNMSRSFPKCPSPISKQRTTSLSNGKGDNYSKAPGSERISGESPFLNSYSTTSAWPIPSDGQSQGVLSRKRNSLNSDAVPFYPPDETVDSVVGNALDDLDLDDNKRDKNGKTEPKMNTEGIWAQQQFPMSDPVSIPQDALRANMQRNPMSSISPTSLSNALGAEAPHPSLASSVPFPVGQFPISVGTPGSLPGSIMSTSLGNMMTGGGDFERMQQKCKQWEDSWNQAKIACDAWKREATEANERARLSEDRRNMAMERCRFLEQQLNTVMERKEGGPQVCPLLHQTYGREELSKFSLAQLQELQEKYKIDLDFVGKLIWDLFVQSQGN